LGRDFAPRARWPCVSFRRVVIEALDLISALPNTPDGITVLSAARSTVETPFRLEPDAAERMVTAAGQGFDVIVVDSPATGIPHTLDLAVVVCAAEVRSSAAATEICAELKSRGASFTVALRHRGWSGLSARDIEKITGGDVAAEIPHLKALTKTTEVAGLPVSLPKKLA